MNWRLCSKNSDMGCGYFLDRNEFPRCEQVETRKKVWLVQNEMTGNVSD